MNTLRQIFIITIIGVLLIAITWVSSEVYIVALGIGARGVTLIHSATIVFWMLFFFSFFSGEIIFGNHIKKIYRLCNIVFGVLFYIFLGSIVLSVVLAVFPTAPAFVALSIITISLICSIAGFIQAQTFTTTTYNVTLHGAPDSWHDKKAIFISDTHFGLMHHKQFSEKIVDYILASNPDMVFHGGDFYDGPSISTAAITHSWKRLTEKIPVFYTSGNHEMYGPYERFIKSIQDAGITVLLDEKTVHDGVQIAGITYRGTRQAEVATKALKALALDPSLPIILINHPPSFHQTAKESGVNLMLSGHTHRGQFSPIGLLTWLIYKKFNYGFHVVEHMTAITSRGVGTAGPPLRLFNPPEFVHITFKTS